MVIRPRPGIYFAAAVALVAAPATSQTTSLVSVSSSNAVANGETLFPSVSADGRYVVFTSYATNLVANDTNGACDVFVRDTQTGTTILASVATGGAQANTSASYPATPASISADGRFVAFTSDATNLVSGDTNGKSDVFVRDLQAGVTTRASVSSSGAQSDDDWIYAYTSAPSLSADGRTVAFHSSASNLVAGDTNGVDDVFLHDNVTGATTLISIGTTGEPTNGESVLAALSLGGRYVAFTSNATNLVAGDTNGTWDVFIRDTVARTTKRVSVTPAGASCNGASEGASVSADGRYVAFSSFATDLVANDSNGTPDVFVRDVQAGTTVRVSVASDGTQGDGASDEATISADGRYVGFHSLSSNFVANDTTGWGHVYVADVQTGTIQRISVAADGTQSNAYSDKAVISADGRWVAFRSAATNLVAGDTNKLPDAFRRGPLFTVAPLSPADTALALRAAGGLTTLNYVQKLRLNTVTAGASANTVDIADAVRVARKAAGLDTNP